MSGVSSPWKWYVRFSATSNNNAHLSSWSRLNFAWQPTNACMVWHLLTSLGSAQSSPPSPVAHTCILPINTNCSSPARLHRRLVHGRFPRRARCPGMLFPRSFVTQPSPSTSSDNPWKLIFSTTILIDSVSLLFCTFIGFLQLRHRTRFRDSFCLASVFKCLSTYYPHRNFSNSGIGF